jgi:hypothetical protein
VAVQLVRQSRQKCLEADIQTLSEAVVSPGTKRVVLGICVAIVLVGAAPLVTKEVHLRSTNVRISPSKKFYAEVTDTGDIRIDRLPCGNVFAPKSAVEVSGEVTELRWKTDDILIVGLVPGTRITKDDSRRFGVKIVIEREQ